ncbi:MAG: CvpA family protein [Kiritimatiellae bacterium]|nr:CvpA family protein [Kiritimatiellia bacterium]
MKPYIIDLLVVAVILWELLMGLRRGLSGELFRLLVTGLVLAAGLGFYEKFGDMIASHSRLTANPEMAAALAFLLIVVGAGVCFFFLRIICTLLVNVKFNDAFDRPAGAAAGIMRGGLIAALWIFAAGLWPHGQLRQMIRVDSYAGKAVFKAAPAVQVKIAALAARVRQMSPEPAPAGPRCPPPAGKPEEEKPRQSEP